MTPKYVSISVSHLLDYTHLAKITTTQWTQMVAIYIDIQLYIDYLCGGGEENSRGYFRKSCAVIKELW